MARRKPDPNAAAGQLVTEVLNETLPGRIEHELRRTRYDNAYEIWRSRLNDDDVRRLKPWEARLRVKYGMQVVDQAMVNIVQGVPKAKCTPRTEASVEAARAMENALAYYTDLAHLDEKQAPIAQCALVYGAAITKQRWLYQERNQNYYNWQDSTIGNRTVVEADRPDMQVWDPYDCWWDPLGRDADDASYVVLRCWPSKDELMRGAYNQDTGTGRYRNLDMLFSMGPAGQPYTTAQDLITDKQNQVYRDRYEVWEVWRNDRLTVIGNMSVLLYDGPKPYWMPGKPITISNTRPDFLRIEGVSETELIDDIQQALQTQDNLRIENQKQTVMRGATVRSSSPDKDNFVMQPYFMWEVENHDDVAFVASQPLPPEAYEEHSTLLSLMQYVTGINPYVTGSSGTAQGIDQNTATGVTLLSGAAGKLLQFKAAQIAQKTWQRGFEQWAMLTKQYLRSEQAMRIEGPGETVTWSQYGPADIAGDYDVRIESSEESLNRQQRRADAIALLNAFAPYVQSGMADGKPLLRQVAEAFGFASPDALFPTQQQQPPAAPSQQYPTPTAPFQLGGQIAPQPAMSMLMGNQR